MSLDELRLTQDVKLLEAITMDRFPVWCDFERDTELIKEGVIPLPVSPHVEQYLETINKEVLAAAATRLRGIGHALKVRQALKRRMNFVLYFSQLRESYKDAEAVACIFDRHLDAAKILVEIISYGQKPIRSIETFYSALNALAYRSSGTQARLRIAKWMRQVFKEKPSRKRSPLVTWELPDRSEFSFALLTDEGLKCHGDKTQTIPLGTRHIRILISAWLEDARVGATGLYENTPREIHVRRERLLQRIGKTASRTNLMHLKQSARFGRKHFLLSGHPLRTVVPIALGFSNHKKNDLISTAELQAWASACQVRLRLPRKVRIRRKKGR